MQESKAPKEKKKPKQKQEGRETVPLRHEFTDKEIRELARKLGAELFEIGKLEQELKHVTSDYKARIQGAEGRRDELNNKITGGYEMRSVEVRVKFFPKKKLKEYYALDGKKEKLATVEMRPSDFIVELPLPPITSTAPGVTVSIVHPGDPLNPVAAAVTEAEKDKAAKDAAEKNAGLVPPKPSRKKSTKAEKAEESEGDKK